jgi:tRNA dimethylallyltransferase
VGGAGFYLRALIEGLPPGSPANKAIRAEVQKKVESMGLKAAHEWLGTLDAPSAERIHWNDRQRICRAIEKSLDPHEVLTDQTPLSIPTLLLGIECQRENLDHALMLRCQNMWKNGLLNEAQYVHSLDLPEDHPVRKIIGYDEANAYLKGETDQTQALEKMFRRTRQYAKRQWTWFRNQHQVQWHLKIPEESPKELVEQLIIKILGRRGKS